VKTQARLIERETFDSRPSVGTVQMTARAAEGVPKFGEPTSCASRSCSRASRRENDFSTGLNVRGGESDQNLILIDGYPIYNPFHVGGLFSTFIDPTVRDVTLMTGGFPARFGGRLSAVARCALAEDVESGVHGTEEISVLSSTGEIAARSITEGHVDARRPTHLRRQVRRSNQHSNPALPFRDEQAHFTYAFTPSTKVAFTVYDGRDDFNANIATFGDSLSNDPSGGRVEFGWGNAVFGTTLTHTMVAKNSTGFSGWLFGDSTTFEQRASVSSFSTLLDLGAGSLTLTNSVGDRRISGSMTAHTKSHDRTFGYDIGSYRIRYNAGSVQAGAELLQLEQNPTSSSVYADDMWRVHPRLLFETGLRGDALTGRGWSDIEPRASAKFFCDEGSGADGGRRGILAVDALVVSRGHSDSIVRLLVASDATTPVSTAWHYILARSSGSRRHAMLRVETF